MKTFYTWLLGLFVFAIVACETDLMEPETVAPNLRSIEFSGWNVDSIDDVSHRIKISPSKKWLDSIVVDSVETIGGASLYLAADADLYNPELGEKLVSKTVISALDTTEFSIVVLDEKNRIVNVWLVLWEEPTQSNQIASSSSTTRHDDSSSSSCIESSSSSDVVNEEEPPSSSSYEESSSSSDAVYEEKLSSTKEVFLSELLPVVNGDTLQNAVTVNGQDVLIEVSYASSLGTALSQMQFAGMDSVWDLRSAKTLNLLSEDSVLTAYRVMAAVQLPGSDFAKRDDSFWGTTSDAMATEATAKVVANYTFSSTANLWEGDNSITLTSNVISCAWAGIGGFKKLATGIYFAGSYSGQNAMNLYDVNYAGGTPSTGESDMSLLMDFGRPFTGRPAAFELTYSYEHVDSKNSEYPQKALAYVILTSEDSKAIAVGALSLETSESTTATVPLSYGADPEGILSSGYIGTSDLTLGSGNEDVSSIRVVFASSAYAHIVTGGSTILNDPANGYRGGEGSSLTLENFRLIYK